MKSFNVYVYRGGSSRYIGQVNEANEELARCAALSRYGVADEDVPPKAKPQGNTIFPGELFDVSPA